MCSRPFIQQRPMAWQECCLPSYDHSCCGKSLGPQCSGDDAAEKNVQFHLGLKHMPEEYMCLLHGNFALSAARTSERNLSSGGSGETVDERVVPQVKPICRCGQRLSFRAILNDPTACDICMTSLREDDSFYQCSSPGKNACVHDFGCCQKCADC
jgi:hypothetical protein